MFADVVRFVRPSRPWSLRLTGFSMLPRMLEGDELLVNPDRSPGLGDVIVFPHRGKLVAHRIIGTGQLFLTAGDASRGALEHVDRADVLGTIVEIRRSGRVVNSQVRSRTVAVLLRARLALKYYLRLVR
jgi:hypothetical protein